MKALNAYRPPEDQPDGLTIEEGCVIHVFKKENATWYGETEGRVGSFPRSDVARSSKVIIIKEVGTTSSREGDERSSHSRWGGM